MTSTINPNIHVGGDATPDEEVALNFKRAKKEIEDLGTVEVKTITSAQLLALNATPIEILPAPGAGFMNVIDAVEVYHGGGTAYAGIATGEDITLKYTNVSGAVAMTIEATGLLDQTTAQRRAYRAPTTELTPVENAAIVAHMLAGEITTGDFPIKLRLTYRTIPSIF